jgi:two-component system, LytTR family, sensor kinase
MKNKLSHILLDLLLKPSLRFYRHLIAQVIIVLMTLSNLLYEPYAFWGERIPFWFVTIILLNILIYTNAYLFVPRMLLKGKPKLYFLSVSGLLLFTILVGLLGFIIVAQHTVTLKESLLILVSSIPETAILLAGITAHLLFRYCIEHKLRIQELQTATMEVELANLKNQINPHFLFNMLNNANILAEEDADKSSCLLEKLNSLLRYQISDGSKNSVSLRDDIDFLNDYLELEKTRRERFDYTVKKEGDCDIHVPPLLFIPFVENAVKHNPESGSYVNLSFCIVDRRLHFKCENPKPRLFHTKRIGGIGLTNVKRRLDLLFGANYNLNLSDEKEKYTVIMDFKI